VNSLVLNNVGEIPTFLSHALAPRENEEKWGSLKGFSQVWELLEAPFPRLMDPCPRTHGYYSE
jgi:hypothetical protein